MKIVTRSSAFLSTLISCTIFSGSLFAGGISLPGIKISPSGVEVGDIKITTDEVKIGDVFTSNDADSSPDGIVLSNGKFVRSDYSGENLAGARLLNSDFTRAIFDVQICVELFLKIRTSLAPLLLEPACKVQSLSVPISPGPNSILP